MGDGCVPGSRERRRRQALRLLLVRAHSFATYPGPPRADPGPTPGRPRAHSRTLRQNRVTTTTTAPITRDELHRKLTSGEPVALFEVLPIGYWRKHHLPTAKSLPPDRVRELVPQLVPDRSAEIVLYCWDFT